MHERIICRFLEDPVGFEPTIRELQSLAFPLGYGSKSSILIETVSSGLLFRMCMVGKTGFEPATSWSQTKRSTKLSYFPRL
jgi:hypothetical protein